MGACGSKLTPEQREQRARSKALERRMSIDNMSEEQKIKLLLLGAVNPEKHHLQADANIVR